MSEFDEAMREFLDGAVRPADAPHAARIVDELRRVRLLLELQAQGKRKCERPDCYRATWIDNDRRCGEHRWEDRSREIAEKQLRKEERKARGPWWRRKVVAP